MPELKPEYADINQRNRLKRHPEEDLRFKIDFTDATNIDPSNLDFEIHYKQKKHPATNPNLDEVSGGSWDDQSNSSYFTVSNQVLKIKIPKADISSWTRRTMYLTLVADDGTDRWAVEDLTVESQVQP